MSTDLYHAYRAWATEPLTTEPVVSVVIPAYNEEWRILPTIGAIASHMSGRGEPWELIVADDGSSDTTVALVEDLGLPNLKLLIAERNGGKGSAVRRGVLAAEGRYILVADADQSTPIEQYDRLLATLADDRHQVAIGSRAATGAAVAKKSVLRHVLSFGLNLIVRVAFPVRARDTQCGFKLFEGTAARTLFSRQIIDGFSFDLEVLYLAEKYGYRTAEVPVEWIDAPGSTVDAAKVALHFLRDIAVIRGNDLRGRYDAPADARSMLATKTAA